MTKEPNDALKSKTDRLPDDDSDRCSGLMRQKGWFVVGIQAKIKRSSRLTKLTDHMTQRFDFHKQFKVVIQDRQCISSESKHVYGIRTESKSMQDARSRCR